jgi:hypothetical protein
VAFVPKGRQARPARPQADDRLARKPKAEITLRAGWWRAYQPQTVSRMYDRLKTENLDMYELRTLHLACFSSP